MSNANDQLRDRYLQLWLQTVHDGPRSTLYMHGGSVIQGTLRGTDSENNRFRVDQLESPLGTYDRAIIRGTDIDMIEWSVSSSNTN